MNAQPARTTSDPDPTTTTDGQKRRDKLRNMAPALIGSLITGVPIPVTARPEAPKSKRAVTRQRSAEMRRAAREAAEGRQEARDEAIAPAITRNAVLDASGAVLRDPNGMVMPDGSVLHAALRADDGSVLRAPSAGMLRAPRVERDGVAFIRVSPLAWMAANVKRAEEDGTDALFTREHVKCATRLSQAWEAVGEGVGLGASDWGSLRGSRGTAPVTPAGHSALVAQVAQRIEIEAARTWMGSAWPCLFDIALGGMSPAAWAAKMTMNRQVGAGYLRAALDRLVEYYRARDREPERRAPKMRAVAVRKIEICSTTY